MSCGHGCGVTRRIYIKCREVAGCEWQGVADGKLAVGGAEGQRTLRLYDDCGAGVYEWAASECCTYRTSTMNTRVLLSSIFFIADSVVSGYLRICEQREHNIDEGALSLHARAYIDGVDGGGLRLRALTVH
jgi:hypothetical protein